MTRASTLRSRKASQARATLAGLLIAAVLMAASPIIAHAWSLGTDSAEMADEIAALLELKPGTTLAEIGAGHGFMAVRMPRRWHRMAASMPLKSSTMSWRRFPGALPTPGSQTSRS
jgi:hypothetical protein